MTGWLSFLLFTMPIVLIFTWGRRLRTRQIDAMRSQDPDRASSFEQAAYSPGRTGLPMRISGFDKRERY